VSRRGAGLVELVVALTVTALLALLAWQILAASAARLRDRSERMALEHALRVGATGLRSTLEPLGADSVSGSDLLSGAPDRIVVRAARATGVACAVSGSALTVRLGDGWWSALRDPVPGRDSLLVDGVAEPPAWHALGLAADPRAGRCPDGTAGLLLPAAIAPELLDELGAGSPVRVFEDVELRLYASAGSAWIGLRDLATGETIQPLAGPFAASGLRLQFVARDGEPASEPAGAVSIRTSLGGFTERAGGVGLARIRSGVPDSVALDITRRSPR
jgi:hypothetical protein